MIKRLVHSVWAVIVIIIFIPSLIVEYIILAWPIWLFTGMNLWDNNRNPFIIQLDELIVKLLGHDK